MVKRARVAARLCRFACKETRANVNLKTLNQVI